ncbi:MAG: OmpW family protein [Gammaproteobacteria bacterium]|nr:OmpW family protein [Gammaproteobacteria bacterium]MDH5593278.1 OmpW family protein [Gammaproteobacteria bacterium]MDH5614142.1 OmpW family protein [Gammaproteobacteria bacterium]
MKLIKSISLAAVLVTSFLSVNTVSADAGDWLVRGRLINVSPNDDSGTLTDFTNSYARVEDATTLEVDFTYMVTNNLGLELILGTTKHDIYGGADLTFLNKIVEAGVLPPTLTLQYHFAPKAKIRPYAGVGVNYTYFYGEKASKSYTDTLGGTSVDLDDSWGLAAQVGVDFDINKNWFINFDVKFIDIDTTASLTTGATVRTIDVDIDPWVFGIGVGTRF